MADPGVVEAGEHRISIRVYYEDTDAAGVVCHASYQKFSERARTEMMRCLELDHGTLRDRFGLVFTVRRCAIDYLALARLDDLLEIRTRMVRSGGASLDLEQRVVRAGRLLTRLDLRLGLLGKDLRLARWPRPLLAAFDMRPAA
jgi:acyl-CoA thioester hydrolase